MGTKLYVGNLNYNTTEDSLRQAFGANGREVTSVAIIMDRETGRSRGFAFVEMATAEGAQQALQQLDGQDLDGRLLRINEAREREARAPGSFGSRPGGPPGGGGFSPSGPPGPRPGGFRPSGGGFRPGGPPSAAPSGGPGGPPGGDARRRGRNDRDRDKDRGGGEDRGKKRRKNEDGGDGW